MQREIKITNDGSTTVMIQGLKVSYHSMHGAVQESEHIFINSGLRYAMETFRSGDLHIFEMGFGTGLNAVLTTAMAEKHQRTLRYNTIEKYPLTLEETSQLNFNQEENLQSLLMEMHECEYDTELQLSPYFYFKKERKDLLDWKPEGKFELLYFDAFAPLSQPELWTENVFRKLYHATAPGGALLTYCSKSSARKAMTAAGWQVFKISGPFGKRDIVRAIRPSLYEENRHA